MSDDLPELYVTRTDAAQWLGVTGAQVDQLAKELGLDACDEKRQCRYTAAHLRRIKALNDRAREIGISISAAGKVHRAIERQKAARQNGEAA